MSEEQKYFYITGYTDDWSDIVVKRIDCAPRSSGFGYGVYRTYAEAEAALPKEREKLKQGQNND